MSYGHSGNKVVISSYSDLAKLSPSISEIHFRKFISRKILFEVLEKCKHINKISVSKSAYSRCNIVFLEAIKDRGIEIYISQDVGRPNSIRKVLMALTLNC